ncbi:EAL domain-containing protein [uncultured Neptuniibacter sp.]|uniref:sensor domain-containing protein n=1 Tax=uncultured Neptuniibacter sp. TaxID=502143 RepID=UPI002636CC2F|nr:EAL domain-containing protein [uncultured Neptuniibacter sp.]
MKTEAELELKKHLGRYKRILQGENDAVWDWDLKKKRVYFSDRWCEMRGLSPDQVTGDETEWRSGIHPDDLPHVISKLEDHLNKGSETFRAEYRIRVSDGSWKWILDRGVAQWNERGEAIRMTGTETDISLQKYTQEELLESERRLSTLIGNLSGMVYRCHAKPPWSITFISDSCLSITGYTPDEIKSAELGSFGAIILPADMPDVEKQVARAIRSNSHFEVNYRIRRKDGEVRWVWERGRHVGAAADGTEMLEGIIDDITEQKSTELALKKSQHRLDFALNRSHTGFWDLSLDDLSANHTLENDQIFGYETLQPEWNYERLLAHVLSEDRAEVDRTFRDALALKRDWNFECRIQRADGIVRWIWVAGGHELDEENLADRMVGLVQDITERKEAEEGRLRYNAELKSLFEALPDLYFRMSSDGTILDYQSQNKGELYTSPENFIGQKMQEVLPGEAGQLFQSKLHEMNEQDQLLVFEYSLPVHHELRHFDARLNRIPLNNEIVCVIRDISDVKRTKDELYRLAHHDTLTGLPNRLHMNEHLAFAIERAKRHNRSLAVIFFDLDNFKIINDSFGHDVGDQLLQQTAQKLVKNVRASDMVIRVSGDEFIIIMEDVHQVHDVEQVVRELLREFQQEMVLAEQRINITASMGICLYPLAASTPQELLRNADAAMYSAKEVGRNTFQFYEKEMTSNAVERVVLENSLRQAIEKEEFELYYQPQINLKDNKIIGTEVLIRWNHPEKGLVLPVNFIPFSEKSGLILEIGRWVLRMACIQAKTWLDKGVNFGRIAVNIAGPQIKQGDLVGMVNSALKEAGLPARYLELEVTENYIMKQQDRAAEQLQRVRDLGVTLSIDDFGTGYSSMSYLKQLPVHKLKIDQGFIRDIPDDPNDMAISKAIIAMGQSLGLTVIAEGVETEQQACFLADAGCHEAQGYLFGKPVDRDRAESIFREYE